MSLFQDGSEKVWPDQIGSSTAAAGTPLVADGSGRAKFDDTGDIPVGSIAVAEGNILIGNSSSQGVALSVKGDGKILVGNGTTATSVAVSGDATLSNAGVVAIGAGKITQAMDAPNTRDGTIVANNAADNVIGSIPVYFQIVIAAGALAAKNITVTNKIRVIDVHVVLTGAGVASTVLTVGNAGNAITNGLDVSGADTAIIRAATLNDANWEIAAGGSLRVTTTVGATQPACIVYVTALRVA